MEMERHNGERSPKGERLRVKRAVQKDTRRQQRIQKVRWAGRSIAAAGSLLGVAGRLRRCLSARLGR